MNKILRNKFNRRNVGYIRCKRQNIVERSERLNKWKDLICYGVKDLMLLR